MEQMNAHPPMPPPLPHFGPVLNNLSSGSSQQGGSSKEFNQHRAPQLQVIKPTTAGLMQYPSINRPSSAMDNLQQVTTNTSTKSRPGSVSPNLMSTEEFKSELIEKQSKISSINAASSIDERMEMRKRGELNMVNVERQDIDNKIVVDKRTSKVESQQMPDKLLSTLQQGKIKPFSYTVAVNDPNNSGKLDLSEIKSPKMRRRLLANMNSTDDEDVHEKEEFVEIQSTSMNLPDSFNHASSNQTQQTNITQNLKQNEANFNLPKNGINCEIRYYEAPRFENSNVSANQPSSPRNIETVTSPIIHYKDPPTFYNTSSCSNVLFDHNNNLRFKNPIKNETSSESYIDELNSEVAKSLESLSQLVENLHVNHRPSSQQTNYERDQQQHRLIHQHQTNPLTQQQLQYKRSTFLPADPYINTLGPPQQRSTCNSPAHTSSQYLVTPSSARSVGDFLVSQDLNYFSAGPNGDPYVMSPYYGCPLEVDAYNVPFNSLPKQSTARTFSPINYHNQNNCSTLNQKINNQTFNNSFRR